MLIYGELCDGLYPIQHLENYNIFQIFVDNYIKIF